MKQMEESAAGLDEVSIGMLTSGGENTMRTVCAIVKNCGYKQAQVRGGKSRHMQQLS